MPRKTYTIRQTERLVRKLNSEVAVCFFSFSPVDSIKQTVFIQDDKFFRKTPLGRVQEVNYSDELVCFW